MIIDARYIAGCRECFGTATRWVGKNAMEAARVHAAETSHLIWATIAPRPGKKASPQVPLAVAAKLKLQSKPPEATIPKERLSKRNMCDGKVAHHTPAQAQKALDKIGDDQEFMNIYACLHCGKFHIGHLIKASQSEAVRKFYVLV